MVPAGKPLGFYNEGNDWFCNAGLPSDLTIVIDEVNFHLHKFPLLSRSGKIEKLIKETQNNDNDNDKDKGTCFITLNEIPGGADGFLVAVKFCYGVPVELTPRNIVMVYCLADYLEMIDVYGDDNLFSKAENYFHKNVLKNWKDCMVALQNCETFATKADDLKIICKCLNAMSTMVCTDSSLFGWPMMMYGRLQSPGGSILWNGIDTGARIQSPESDWWFDDASCLGVALFERFVKTLEARGIPPEKLTGAIMYYCGKHLHGLGRWQGAQITKTKSIANFSTKSDTIDQRFLLETIVELLPQTKGKSICRFLLGLLRVGLILGVDAKCQDSLERRIGMQLDLATLDGLMIPSYSDSDTLYNTECVERIISYYLTSEETGSTLSSSLIPSSNVSKLVDSYMAEIASDVNLKPEKLHSLAQALPESSRSLSDGLYRAVDIYFEVYSCTLPSSYILKGLICFMI
ncbi:putative BTB/POZ domain, NPH3 domain, NPH3/RPT2-like family protein [Helianthus annuus]|nr:putative BTB/POZ domain, NPH3 domain, NPH3/RPT2-like family protein [Helianthus annuus]KAJ0486669.1 putative BTB/POZ domain, NPH3 domain, NPH3/RPT2-like family protein [Helianthus annuus]